MKTTTNFGLKKPEGTDYINVNDLNENADKIDTELKSHADSIAEIGTHLADKMSKPLDATNGNIGIFDTNEIKDSGFTIAKSVPSDAKFTDTVYEHPITPGNKHLPAGGDIGQFLCYGGASGEAIWSEPETPIENLLDFTIAARNTFVNITGLDLTGYKEILVKYNFILHASSATTLSVTTTFNNNGNSVYYSGTSVAQKNFKLCDVHTTSGRGFGEMKISQLSNSFKLMSIFNVNTGMGNVDIREARFGDVASPITSIQLSAGGGFFDVGSTITILGVK